MWLLLSYNETIHAVAVGHASKTRTVEHDVVNVGHCPASPVYCGNRTRVILCQPGGLPTIARAACSIAQWVISALFTSEIAKRHEKTGRLLFLDCLALGRQVTYRDMVNWRPAQKIECLIPH